MGSGGAGRKAKEGGGYLDSMIPGCQRRRGSRRMAAKRRRGMNREMLLMEKRELDVE